MRKTVLTFLFFSTSLLLWGQTSQNISKAQEKPPLTFKVSTPKQIRLAEPFQLIFTLEGLENRQIHLSTDSFSSEDFEVLKIAKIGANVFEFTVMPFNIGISTFSSIEFSYENAVSKTPELPLKIEPYFEKPDKTIKDIRSPIFFLNLWHIVFMLILAALSYLAYKKISAKKELPLIAEKETEEWTTPYEKALKKTKNLKDYPPNPFVEKEFYDTLSEIFRIYLLERIGLQAPKMTTFDAVKALKNRLNDIHLISKIRDFLDNCDLAKFAKFTPGKEEALKNAESALNILTAIEEFLFKKEEEERKKRELKNDF